MRFKDITAMGYVRKHLSTDSLLQTVRQCLNREKFKATRSEYTWTDCIMSGLAIFGFKFPSLLQFEKNKVLAPTIKKNLATLYGVTKAPSDTCLRERLDQLMPSQIRRSFKKIFAILQRGKLLEQYCYLDGSYIISIDGTGQYCSKAVHCNNCCEKLHRDGSLTYYHHMLGAALVHPDNRVVIPFAPEPIVKGDGDTKNDCERNAAKRLLADLRRDHPHLKILIVEDGLASNFPHLSLLDSLEMNYIIGVKPGDHTHLFDWISALMPKTHIEESVDGTIRNYAYYTDVPINDANHDYRVNVLEYVETKPSGKQQKFSWVTKLDITTDNVYQIMRAGRSRWKIENETFNTLKNQGYNFEHNYGHGYNNLCSVMTMLMVLTFLIDQVQQLCCKVYRHARKHACTPKALFETVRSIIKYAHWDSWLSLYEFIGNPPG